MSRHQTAALATARDLVEGLVRAHRTGETDPLDLIVGGGVAQAAASVAIADQLAYIGLLLDRIAARPVVVVGTDIDSDGVDNFVEAIEQAMKGGAS